MPSRKIIIQPTSYTISSNASAVIKLSRVETVAVISQIKSALDITPQATQQTIKQNSNKLQLVASKQTLTVLDSAPNIKSGQVKGIIKAARFDRVGVFDYIGAALSATSSETSKVWRIRRIRNNLPNAAQNIESVNGLNSYASAWVNRLNEVYA